MTNPSLARFAIVASKFNAFITDRLVDAALERLVSSGFDDQDVATYHVPGAWELPVAARALADTGRFSAIICLGCVIRGQTPHFEYVAGQAAAGLMRVAVDTGVPCAFGLITADTMEQAIDRAGGKFGNKGADAADAAISMAGFFDTLATEEQTILGNHEESSI